MGLNTSGNLYSHILPMAFPPSTPSIFSPGILEFCDDVVLLFLDDVTIVCFVLFDFVVVAGN